MYFSTAYLARKVHFSSTVDKHFGRRRIAVMRRYVQCGKSTLWQQCTYEPFKSTSGTRSCMKGKTLARIFTCLVFCCKTLIYQMQQKLL